MIRKSGRKKHFKVTLKNKLNRIQADSNAIKSYFFKIYSPINQRQTQKFEKKNLFVSEKILHLQSQKKNNDL